MQTSMLAVVVALAIVAGSRAHADPKAPDLTMIWDSGEMSEDASMWRTTVTVTGTRLHYEAEYSGRNGGMPGTKPRASDTTVRDPKRLAAALVAYDKTKDPLAAKPRQTTAQRDSICIQRGKASRCANHINGDPETPDFTAAVEVKAALLDGIKAADLAQ